MDFTTRCVQAIRDKNYQAGSYKVRPHGICIEVELGKMKIDKLKKLINVKYC